MLNKMEVNDCLSFVIDTLQKVQFMVKILHNVANELYSHTQGIKNANIKSDHQLNGNNLQKNQFHRNSVINDMPLDNLTLLINAYLDNTVITSDSILAGKCLNEQSNRNGKQTQTNIEVEHAKDGSGIPILTDSWLDRNFKICETINTDMMRDTSLLANNTNSFITKLTKFDDSKTDGINGLIIIDDKTAKQKEIPIKVNVLEKTKINEDIMKQNEIQMNDLEPNVAQINEEFVGDCNEKENNALTLNLKASTPFESKKKVEKKPRRIKVNFNHRLSRRLSIPKVIVRTSLAIGDIPKPHKCPVHGCNYAGKKKNYLTKHMKRHSNETLFDCKNCPKKFKDKNVLDAHISLDHYNLNSEITVQTVCTVCAMKFENEIEKNAHETECNRSNFLSCQFCSKHFKQRHKLIEHEKIHEMAQGL